MSLLIHLNIPIGKMHENDPQQGLVVFLSSDACCYLGKSADQQAAQFLLTLFKRRRVFILFYNQM